MSSSLSLSEIEKEIIVLKAVSEIIDSIINYEILEISGNLDANIRFHSSTHAKFFNLVMVDLLSKTDEKGFLKSRPYLSYLGAITQRPHFDVNNSVGNLSNETKNFRSWLRTNLVREIWLPSIGIEIEIKLSRFELIKIGGNICRHNFLRAFGIAKEVQKIMERNGKKISLDQSIMVLHDINEWFHNDIFQYHSSTIAEFLNNIRWGIYSYIYPEYVRSSYQEGLDPVVTKFSFPNGVESEFGKQCYWGLMVDIRRKPYVKQFQVTEWLKKRY
jgi:hypothetical protein